MHHCRTLLFALLFSRSAYAQWPNPEPCSGNCHVHDPSLVRRSDGTYFLFGSAPNISVKTAPSITGPWTLIPGGLVPSGGIQLGAPDVQKGPGDDFYLYYQKTILGTQDSNISWGVSQNLDPGTWTFGGHVDIPKGNIKNNYNRIDPNLRVLGNGTELYLSFGSYWDDIFQLRMHNASTVSPGTLTHLAENVTTYDPTKTNVGSNPLEGSYQFAWPINGNERYYLFFSSGACCKNSSVVPLGDEYKVMVCRSSQPTGPFSDRDGKSCLTENGGTMILASHDDVYAPGGQGVMYDEVLESVVLYYHYLNATNEAGNAFFGWNYLDFDDAGWPSVTTKASNTSTGGSPTSTSAAPKSTASSSASMGQAHSLRSAMLFWVFGAAVFLCGN